MVAKNYGLTSRLYSPTQTMAAEISAHPGLDLVSLWDLAKDWQTAEGVFSSSWETAFDADLTTAHDNDPKALLSRLAWGEDGTPTWPTYGTTLRLLNRDNHSEMIVPVADDAYLRRLWILQLRHWRSYLRGDCPEGGHQRGEHMNSVASGIGGVESPEMSIGYSNTGEKTYLGTATLASGMNGTQTTLTLAGAYSAYPTGAAVLVVDQGGASEEYFAQRVRSGATVTLRSVGTDGYTGRGWNNQGVATPAAGKVVKYLATGDAVSTTYDGRGITYWDEYRVNFNEWAKHGTEAQMRVRYKEVWRRNINDMLAYLGGQIRTDGSSIPMLWAIGALWGSHDEAQALLQGDTPWDGSGLADVFGNRLLAIVTSYNGYYDEGTTFETISSNLFNGLQMGSDHGIRIGAQNKGVTTFPSNSDEGMEDYVWAMEHGIRHLPMSFIEPQTQRFDEAANKTTINYGGYAGYTSDNLQKYTGADALTPVRSDALRLRMYGDVDVGDGFFDLSDEEVITAANVAADAVTIAGGTITCDTAQTLWSWRAARFDVAAGLGDINLRYSSFDSIFAYPSWSQRWETFDTGQDGRLGRWRYAAGNLAFVGYSATTKYLQIRDAAGNVQATGTVALQADTDYIFRSMFRGSTSGDARVMLAVYDDGDSAVPVDVITYTGFTTPTDEAARFDLGMVGKGSASTAHKFWIGDVWITDFGHDTFRYGDPAPPVADVYEPEEGDELSGTYYVKAFAYDTASTELNLDVEVKIDSGSWQTAAWSVPQDLYSFTWDTTLETDDTHTVTVRATDQVGHITESDVVTVTVLNGGPTYHDGAAVLLGTGALAATADGVVMAAAQLAGVGRMAVTGWSQVDAPSVYVGGVEWIVDFGSLTITDRIGERSTASFVLWGLDDTAGAIDEGAPVTIYDPQGNVAFDGFVYLPEQLRPNPDDTVTRWQVDAIDFHYLADKRQVADAWEDVTVATIVGDLIANVLAEEGITAGTIATGPVLSEVVFNYITCSRALDRLAVTTGHIWWIDHGKALHFVATTGTPSGTVDADDCKAAPKLRRVSPDYRNRQVVRGAMAYTDPQVESFKGDGEMITFTVGYPVGQVPTVKVNTVAKTVGIRGVDADKDWYWNKGDQVVTQDDGGTVLSATDTLEITYVGLYSIVTIANDTAEQIRRAGVEGVGTGKVEATVNVSGVFGNDAALEAAVGLLGTYSQEGRTLTFVTAATTYEPGTFVTVNLPELDENDEAYLVTQVETRDLSREEWDFTVTAVQGADAGSWQARLAAGLAPPEVLAIRENISESETLLVLAQTAEAWALAEAVAQTVWACPVPSSTLYPTTTLYPC